MPTRFDLLSERPGAVARRGIEVDVRVPALNHGSVTKSHAGPVGVSVVIRQLFCFSFRRRARRAPHVKLSFILARDFKTEPLV